MNELGRRLIEALASAGKSDGLPPPLERYVEQRGDDPATRALGDRELLGLTRLLASHAETAAYLASRPDWLAELAPLDTQGLSDRAEEFYAEGDEILRLDLEDALDTLRLRRRDQMARAACAHLAGHVDFANIARFLSHLAEATTRSALDLARRELSGRDLEGDFAVIGMGKVAGREFTYHSDLDLIFLFRGDTADIDRATRIGQRLIAYLTTQTGAGIAYAVDTRLRPSGQQGMLVTSFEGYERYQTEQAATWEHLAMLRARPIAGAIEEAAERLARIRARVLPASKAPWAELAALRQRVVDERAVGDDGASALKTGAGGLMDADFLAGGGLLEQGSDPYPDPPSVDAMLEASVGEQRAGPLLEDYQELRRIEACARWVAGSGLESLPEDLSAVAPLIEPGLSTAQLRERVRGTRARIRERYVRVIEADTITAL